MGDMKTPDFDDLLAAFDIPDIDAKEAIQSNHEDSEGHVKQSQVTVNETAHPNHTLLPTDVSAVSVIVKKVTRTEPLEPLEGSGKDRPSVIGSGLVQNGLGASGVCRSLDDDTTLEAAATSSDDESWDSKTEDEKDLNIFSQFEAVADSEVERQEDKPETEALFCQSSPVFSSPSLNKQPSLESIGPLSAATVSPPATPEREEDVKQSVVSVTKGLESKCKENGGKTSQPNSVIADENSVEHLTSVTTSYNTVNSPISSLSMSEPNPGSDVYEPVQVVDGIPYNRTEESKPLILPVQSPREHTSPGFLGSTEGEEVDEGHPQSPQSLSSDSDLDEGNDSPSSNSSRPLKVRIKTIKTSTGGITRTVTRVSSDSDPGAVKQSPKAEQNFPESDTDILPTLEGKAEDPKENIESSSISKTETCESAVSLGSDIKPKAAILPVSTIQSASSAMLIAASVVKQKAVVLPEASGSVIASKILNLMPQTLPKAAATANINLTAQNTTAVTATSPKVNGTVMIPMPKPLPVVPSTVISRNQSSLVEAFNKILNSKNLLPTYRPNLCPPSETSLTLPPSGYRCLECGDSFALERSLARHYDRRSMRIEVTCNHCTKRVVFFNKCSFLLHAREHKDKGLIMQCSHLVMRPIALDQMVGQPDITPLASLTPKKTVGMVQDTASLGAKTHTSLVLPLKSDLDQLNFNNFRCLECNENYHDKTGLARHMQQVATSGANLVCSVCSMLMPNSCSFNAHCRIHRNLVPHLCPECGGVCRPAHFQTHLRDICLHFSRRVGYRCPSCGVVFGGVNSIKSHIQMSHCEIFHKCPVCPMAFKSAPSALSHIYTQHPGFSSQQSKMIYKCAMCDTVFTHKPLLSSHFDQHLVNQRVNVFKCPDCPLLFAQKRTMLEHFKSQSIHNNSKPQEAVTLSPAPPPAQPIAPQTPVTSHIPKQDSSDSPSTKSTPSKASPNEEESSSEDKDPPSLPEPPRRKMPSGIILKGKVKRTKGSGWTCGICHRWFPEKDDYVIHMKRDHGKCVKKFPCCQCDRSFCSSPSLRRHVRVNHEGIKRVFPCRYCTEGKTTFSSHLILKKHIQVRHGIKVADHTKSHEIQLPDKKQSTESTVCKRKFPIDMDSCSEEPDSTTPPTKNFKAARKSNFRCRKCGFVTDTTSDFYSHIIQHRTDSSSHQCRECGLCFTSALSLNRHRFIIHKVKDTADDTADLQSYCVLSEEPGTAEGKAQCKVCKKVFDSQLNLKTHFRTHGMAFIKERKKLIADN
ncbi:zinc finger protein 687 [Protopterus annectens]|uniref:zinc finger protein 687 n=1 Tax=Protopterus annectens TaxID=7888 RepID=UPI001CF93CA0|nr:zinc finger protein 687 [Protopterus annectens]